MELCALAPPGHKRKWTRALARSVSPRPLYAGIFFRIAGAKTEDTREGE